MESQPDREYVVPTAAEASRALDDAEHARTSVLKPWPWWYFIGLTVFVAPLPLIQLAPDPPLGVVVLLGAIIAWAGALGLFLRSTANRTGVIHRLSTRQVRLLAGLGALICAVTMVAKFGFDIDWATSAMAELAALFCLAIGIVQFVRQRRSRAHR